MGIYSAIQIAKREDGKHILELKYQFILQI